MAKIKSLQNIEIKEEISKLVTKLNRLSYEYYILNDSSVSDEEYDKLINDLKQLEKLYPEYILKNSPTQSVGSSIKKSNFPKIQHSYKMYSLDNAFNKEELFSFDNRVKKLLNTSDDIEYLVEMKIDGLSLNLTYNSGKLISAATRGDGYIGEDITSNVLSNITIPKTIGINEHIEIRGEIVLLKNDFKEYKNEIIKLNNKIIKYNLENEESITTKLVPANARNASSGLLRYVNKNDRNLSSNFASQEFNNIKNKYINKLNFFAYQVPNFHKLKLTSQNDILEFLHKLELQINSNYKVCKSILEVNNFLESYEDKLHDLSFEADGIVIKVNQVKFYPILGYTNKFPRWAIAYKYKTLDKVTLLKDIFITIGRTGKVTYNAEISPIEIDGSTIQFATLHNYDYVRKLKLNIGCNVRVIKSGGIIPKVTGRISDGNEAIKIFPKIKYCPSCNSELIQYDGKVDDFCININCPSRIKYSLVQFCQKDAMNITGLGETLIEKLFLNNVITNIKDIYALANNDNTGQKLQEKFLLAISTRKNNDKVLSAENSKILQKIILSIHNSKNHSLERLLLGLGIWQIGQKNAKILAEKFGSMDNIISSKLEDFEAINGFGIEAANSIYKFFKLNSNMELIRYLKSQKINFNYINNKNINIDNVFYKKNFLITGSFNISRAALKSIIENLGGNYLSSVSKNLDYLIVGNEPGNKLNKAKELGIRIIEENELNEYIKI